jgi:hypothetical protein
MWTLLHGKRLVNGSSGFDPPFTKEIRAALLNVTDPQAVARVRSVYPLRFVLVHLDRLLEPERTLWEQLGQTPPAGFRVVGSFAKTLVFEPDPGSERSRRWERTFATDLVTAHPHARVSVALAREDPEIQPAVDVMFNGRHLLRHPATVAPADLRVALPSPYPRADRNVLRLELAYRLLPHLTADSRYRIAETGVSSPVDLVVTSAGKEHGRTALIAVNGMEVSPNLRGYNVIVVDPRSGGVAGRAVFDTFAARAESARLADFIDRVPAGWIVAAAVKDDGVGQLGDDAVLAFRSLGGQADPRREGLFVSHLLVGVKGAAAGTAVEALGAGRLTRVVGEDRGDLLVTRDFRLE